MAVGNFINLPVIRALNHLHIPTFNPATFQSLNPSIFFNLHQSHASCKTQVTSSWQLAK